MRCSPQSLVLGFLLIFTADICLADELDKLKNLKKAYPDFIKAVTKDYIVWFDSEKTNIRTKPDTNSAESFSILDQINQPEYPSNKMVNCETYIPTTDPGRIRSEIFFAKMYQSKEEDVKNNLETVYWMPKFFGHQYPVMATRINGVSKKLQQISDQLELLVNKYPDLIRYLNMASAYNWRHIEKSSRRSPHSYGIAIDIDPNYANYWLWDTGIQTNRVNQSDKIIYRNNIPCEIVTIFENNGFIWGGKWLHYDTMHFEYRPELLIK